VSSVGGLHMYDYKTPPADVVPGASPKVVHLFVPRGDNVIVLKHVRNAEFVEVGTINTESIQMNSKRSRFRHALRRRRRARSVVSLLYEHGWRHSVRSRDEQSDRKDVTDY
jgi:hypothetical protein